MMRAIHGSLAGNKVNRNPSLTIIAGTDVPTSLDFLYAKYCAAHARWSAAKSEVTRKAVREAYEAFGVAFCGDAAFIVAEAARIWCVVT